MPALAAYDGTKLAYHVLGEGAPLVCLPGGPTQDSHCPWLDDPTWFTKTIASFLG